MIQNSILRDQVRSKLRANSLYIGGYKHMKISPKGTMTPKAQLWLGILIVILDVVALALGSHNKSRALNNFSTITQIGGIITGTVVAWSGYRRMRR